MGFSCGCDEGPEFCRVNERRARKAHQCFECGHEIAPGETYEDLFMVTDGIARTFRTCERCADLIASFTTMGYCYGLGRFFDDYGEWLEDMRPFPGDDEDPPSGMYMAYGIQLKHRNWELGQ
jgi:hypothetical protein